MTGKEIAKKLRLSPATVSLALNNKPGVNPKTRERVLKEAKLQGLLERKQAEEKKNILFLEYRKNGIGSNQNYFSQIFSGVIEGIETQAREKGCMLSMVSANKNNFEEILSSINLKKVNGLLVLATELEVNQILCLENLDIPIVLLDNYCEESSLNSVTINNEQGVELAIRYLIHRGHSDIGYFHVEGDAVNFKERYFAFKRSIELHNLSLKNQNIISFSTLFGGEAVFEELKKRLEKLNRMPTAFFADNDIIAIYAIRALRDLGLRVPQDVSIIGFDNIPITEFIDPPLTSIKISKYALGSSAVSQLLQLMRGQLQGVQKVEIQTSLVERKSVGRLRN
jgi:DNA-binding LacI/PurR family transcriptional regulator